MGLILRPCKEDSIAIKLVTEEKGVYVWGAVHVDLFAECADDDAEARIYTLLSEGKEVKVNLMLDETY